MELIRRNNKTTNQEIVARATLRNLAQAGRTWTNHPSSNRFTGNNYNSNANLNSNMNNNQAWAAWRAQYADQDALIAAAAPNYSKASGALKKWLAARPHTIYQNVVQIKLPNNAEDPVSYKNFKAGNEAVMVVKKRLLSNGAMRSRRTFYNKNTIERLAQGKKWRTILRMKGSDVVFKDPLNRRTVYRRDLMTVKFV